MNLAKRGLKSKSGKFWLLYLSGGIGGDCLKLRERVAGPEGGGGAAGAQQASQQ